MSTLHVGISIPLPETEEEADHMIAHVTGQLHVFCTRLHEYVKSMGIER